MTFYICDYIAKTIPVSAVISIEDAIKTLGVSRSTIYRLIKNKRIPSPIIINNRIKGWRADDFELALKKL